MQDTSHASGAERIRSEIAAARDAVHRALVEGTSGRDVTAQFSSAIRKVISRNVQHAVERWSPRLGRVCIVEIGSMVLESTRWIDAVRWT